MSDWDKEERKRMEYSAGAIIFTACAAGLMMLGLAVFEWAVYRWWGV